VTVLFVDIRGYTGIAETRSPNEIFAFVNAYTTAVSSLVRDHGGWVVEFQGDGLMAVFGAPRALPKKERAAVTAGLAIAERAAQGVLVEGADVRLSVGIGIASGPAYVGDVQSVDRRIWCVIGNATNLAARLQSMTRDLGVYLVIDDATHRAAAGASAGFGALPDVRVKGRSGSFVVHVHPAPRAAEA
jgi:adenylate cyclase